LLAVAVIAALPAAASAGVLVRTTTSCASESLSQPFVPWLDGARYTLAPGGAFEAGGPNWNLAGSATIVAGSESFRVHAPGDARALRIPSGSSAQSPAMCVGLGHPTLRLFARRTGGSLLSTLRVDVLFEDNLGLLSSLPIGVVLAGSQWTPSLPLPVVANLLPLLPGQQTPVAFRLTPQGGGTWDVDDFYVDPWSGR
jgi:hypothetical protein